MLKILNPATGAVVQTLEEDTAAGVAEKFEKARRAQRDWARVSHEERAKVVRAFASGVAAEAEDLARTLTQEMGKPIAQSRNELKALQGRIDFFLEKFVPATREEVVLQDAAQKLVERITHEPLGVIGNISAWNYPYFVGSNVFVPAILTGNSVLYKPSEFSTLTGLKMAELWKKAGLPDGVFTPLVGTGQVGAMMLEQPLAGVFFTGSYGTGRKIAEAAAKKLMRVQLELGGKDPSYVTDDVDVKAAAESTADGAFYNTGQSCCSVERIYVHEKVYEPFMEAFMNTVKGFVLGDPMNDQTYIGAITRAAHLDYLEAQVKDAISKGAKLLCGGKRKPGPGNYFEPTVLAQVNHTMEVMREETFGPVIGIQKVASDEEALTLMNDTQYGLTAGVYSRDRVRAEKLLAGVNAGSAYWNCCDRVSPRLPWSGRRHSGLGCTLSTYGIQAFTQMKAWHLRG